jgi:hypothetical protein
MHKVMQVVLVVVEVAPAAQVVVVVVQDQQDQQPLAQLVVMVVLVYHIRSADLQHIMVVAEVDLVEVDLALVVLAAAEQPI